MCVLELHSRLTNVGGWKQDIDNVVDRHGHGAGPEAFNTQRKDDPRTMVGSA